MKKIAVLGSGAIGGMLAGYLAKAGEDVTLLSAFRRETARQIAQEGITVSGPYGTFHTPVNAAFLDDLPGEAQYDYVFLGLKANDYVSAVTRLRPHLKADGCVITLQNGINEEFLIPIVGTSRVVAGISFAGGKQISAVRFEDHDGSYTIGELDGSLTPRIAELAALLTHVRPTAVSQNIRAQQWIKLGTVALHVPCCTLAGVCMQEAFGNPDVQRMFPLLAAEVFAVAAADGCPQETVMGRTREQWSALPLQPRQGEQTECDPAHRLPEKIVDAYTKDILRGAPLEIDYTNGAIVRLGRRYGIPTPANEAVIAALRRIEAGQAEAGHDLMEEVYAALLAIE